MGTYQGRPTTREEISTKIQSIIYGAVIDPRDNTVYIPNLKLAIIIDIWRPNQYDRFSLCYSDGKEFKVLIDNAVIYSTEYVSPAIYVANYCIKYALEKYKGRYLTDAEESEIDRDLSSPIILSMLKDAEAYYSLR
ncbi:MAG: hypothetical protein K2M79_03990 [Muribaculaceae bacterium]|nr:hypothetical protein [Muribaculaceae bacterium]